MVNMEHKRSYLEMTCTAVVRGKQGQAGPDV
jgi:hypothetical protein